MRCDRYRYTIYTVVLPVLYIIIVSDDCYWLICLIGFCLNIYTSNELWPIKVLCLYAYFSCLLPYLIIRGCRQLWCLVFQGEPGPGQAWWLLWCSRLQHVIAGCTWKLLDPDRCQPNGSCGGKPRWGFINSFLFRCCSNFCTCTYLWFPTAMMPPPQYYPGPPPGKF